MLEYLKSADKHLLLSINKAHTPFWDEFMITCTDKFFWIPFYAALLLYLMWKFRLKSILLFICIALLITTADQFSSTLMKPLFARLRPCHDPSINYLLYLAKGCGGIYGFVSSHAANSFALAAFLTFTVRNSFISFGLFLWAAMVSYSRIYLGAHFPGDIVMGALAGILFGFIYYKIYFLLLPMVYKTAAKPVNS